jgi:hypothetical protein
VSLPPRAGRAEGGCLGFWLWALAGGALSFAFLTGFSIGLFVLPLAVGTLFVAASRAPHLAESVGFLTGVGGTLFAIGVIQLQDPQGLAPEPWLLAGSLCAGFGVAGYAVVRRCASA